MIERTVVLVAFDDIDLLDATGPAEVLSLAKRESQQAYRYRFLLAAQTLEPVRTGAGVRLLPDVTFDDLAGQSIDTLIVPGAAEVDAHGGIEALVRPEIVTTVRSLAASSRRVAALCVGAHVLANAGLLNGRRVATHWATAAQLSAGYPSIQVDAERIFVRDGDVWTCAGIGSCLDLTLALLAEDLGEDVAVAVARHLVVFHKRQGDQQQISPLLRARASTRRIDDLKRFILDHADRPLTVSDLAAQARVSERHVARLFRSELDSTPHAYVEAVRVELARNLLDASTDTLTRIAAATGLGSVDSLVRAFQRQTGMTPTQYRQRGTAPSQPT